MNIRVKVAINDLQVLKQHIEKDLSLKNPHKLSIAKETFEIKISNLVSSVLSTKEKFQNYEPINNIQDEISIKLHFEIEKEISEEGKELEESKKIYDKEVKKMKRKKGEFWSEDEFKENTKKLELIGKQLSNLKNSFEDLNQKKFSKKETENEKEFQKNKKNIKIIKRDLTEEEKLFLRRTSKNDAELNEKIKFISEGLKELGNISDNIGNEINYQKEIVDKILGRSIEVGNNIDTGLDILGKTIDSIGGYGKIFTYMGQSLIIVGIWGYIINTFRK